MASRDTGLSLVEVLVAVALMGIGVAAVLGSLGVSISGSATHRAKVEALATLESASAAIEVRADPCTTATYLGIARSGVSDALWRDRLTVTGLTGCGTDLHRVALQVAVPSGLTQSLDITVGGPRVADSRDASEFVADPDAPIISCAVTSVVAEPVRAGIDDSGLLRSAAVVTIETDAVCSGTLRARFTPAPIAPDEPGQPELEPPFQLIGERLYQLTLVENTYAWEPGPSTLSITNERPDGTSGLSGTATGFLEIVSCDIEASVDEPTPTRRPNGRLTANLLITVQLNEGCATPGSMTYSVVAAEGVDHTGALTPSAGLTWTGSVPGQEDIGPMFDPGPNTIVISTPDGPIASIPIEVS